MKNLAYRARRWLAGWIVQDLFRPEPGDRIVALTSHQGKLYVATQYRLYVIATDWYL